MAFRVLYDANAVFGALQRSVLVRVGEKQPSFNLRVLLTDEILTEMIRAVSSRYSDFDDTQAINLKTAMIEAIPDCLVTGYQHRLNEVYISDPDDRHVVAAALHAQAQIIVTDDQHFDPASLAPHDLEAQSPDDFLTDLFDLNEPIMRQLVGEEASERDIAYEHVVDLLETRSGLIRFAQHLRR